MTDTSKKLREALRAYQDANEMSPYGDYSKIEWESSAGPVNPSWGGGDCKKHGRWYGRCYSCSDEWDNLRKSADRDAYTARENALNAAKQMARQALALPTAEVMTNGLTQSETDASASVSGLTAAPVGDLPELPEPAAWRTPDEWPMCYQYTHEEPDAERIQWAARYGRKHEQVFTADQMRAYALSTRSALSAGDAVDAQRYRWLRDEAWAGYNQGKGFPHVFTIDGAGNRRTMLAEDALDASIDAAMRKGQL